MTEAKGPPHAINWHRIARFSLAVSLAVLAGTARGLGYDSLGAFLCIACGKALP